MKAIRVALTVGTLLWVAVPQSYAAAAPIVEAGQAVAVGAPVRVGQNVAPLQNLRGDSKKPIILTLATLLIALDLYEILRHHHHPTQPVSP